MNTQINITPDSIVFARADWLVLNATIFYTWVVMAMLVIGSWLITRRLRVEGKPSRWQVFLETTTWLIRSQIRDVTQQNPDRFLPFLGSLLLFISLSNFLAFVPGYYAPTGSLNTTGALAFCVFLAVPIYGIYLVGIKDYFLHYIQPVVFMLPFNILSEFSRTLALAVRLFGNVMSGMLITAVLLSVAPLFVPVIMHAFGLLIGQIHAFIFAVLSAVYIASATQAAEEERTGETAA